MPEHLAVVASHKRVTARPQPAAHAERMVALDAFRGIAIAGMILVNNPGEPRDVYDALQHSAWNGCTLADLIFPFFLFIVGVAAALSIGGRLSQATPLLYRKVLQRTLIIFFLGVVLNAFPILNLYSLRIPGVLQRIALCYCAVSLLVVTTSVRTQAAIFVAILAGYWAAMKWVPVPDFGAEGLGVANNLAAYVDTLLLRDHLAHRNWDPEGVLTTLPAIATTLIGVLAGHWLRARRSALERVAALLVVGNAAIVLGLFADVWFPINKNLWSPAYVLFTGGVALNLFASCYWLIDVQGFRSWATPFVVYGTNPLLAYFSSTLMSKTLALWRVARPDQNHIVLRRLVHEHLFLPLASPYNASLLYAIAYVLFWLGLMSILYRQRIFVKI